MATDTKGKRGAPVRLTVSAKLLHVKKGEETPKVFAYVFSLGGRLLSHGELDPNGECQLTIPASGEPTAARVLVGPEMDAKDITMAALNRRGAAEKVLRIEPKDLTPRLGIEVLSDQWRAWLFGICCVRGTLLKRVTTGGVQVDFPVCHATVEIYEVDPVWIIIDRLPDLVLERFRDWIIDPRWPIPPIDPDFPFPPPRPQPDPVPPFRTSQPGRIPQLESQQIPQELQLAARTRDMQLFRRELSLHPQVVRPWLCLYWPYGVTTTKVCEARTDECGKFQCCFFKGFHNPDTPDLYFKAKQRIFGLFNVTILERTPIRCYTYWNYKCGSEITLYTNHPLAITCSPCPPVEAPNNWVLVMAIGNLSLSRIRGTSKALAASTTASNKGLTGGNAPFGGLLRPRIEFDNSLREDLGVMYYKVSYRPAGVGNFVDLNTTVNRHYTHEVGGDLVIEPYNLGPKVVGAVGNLFEIPPAVPPVGQWTYPNVAEDHASTYFPTDDLVPPSAADKYEIKIDLFDGAGQPVNINTLGIKFRVPSTDDLSGTITTDDAADPVLNLVAGNSFIMTVHVDNNPCFASIAAPTISGVPADDNCGVLKYTPGLNESVTMAYTASHPNGYATYNFTLYRGVNPVTPPTTTGPVGTGSFSQTVPVADLLGGCTVAGFSENLYVRAMATNGWGRLQEYDASDVRAFVLSRQG